MNQFYALSAEDVSAVPREVAHFLGYPYNKTPEDDIANLINDAMSEMQKILRPNLVYEEFDCNVETPNIKIADFELQSESLSKNLKGCKKVVMFAATVGSDVDKLIRKYQTTDTVKASVMQATGAMFIESFVDSFNEKIKCEAQAGGMKTKPRFSPGYGDVPLDVQRIFFKYLNCAKIGLTLMDTLVMAPEKSVTAFIGIEL